MRTGRMTSIMHIKDLMYTCSASNKPEARSGPKLFRLAAEVKSETLITTVQANKKMQARGMGSNIRLPLTLFDPKRPLKKSWYINIEPSTVVMMYKTRYNAYPE